LEMPAKSILGIIAATAGSFFALGAYYQHIDVLRNIQRLEQRNPHAYFIRRKLYRLLGIFSVQADGQDVIRDDEDGHKLAGIMKYGFPSTNDISLNEAFEFVTSFDRRNSSIHWMCERVDISHNTTYAQPTSSIATSRAFNQSEAARVFFLSNIKPFMNRGFNLTVWERLLQHVNEMSRQHGTVYVYTGSIYLPRELKSNNWFLEYQTEDRIMVAVPTHFFKILVVDSKFGTDSTPYAEAYVMPNSPLNDNVDLKTLLNDIREIENITGLRFFEGLDRNFVNTQITSSVVSFLTNPVESSVNHPVASSITHSATNSLDNSTASLLSPS
ncbi:hypothetical protein KR200_003683, partial [Drosophila serrata]